MRALKTALVSLFAIAGALVAPGIAQALGLRMRISPAGSHTVTSTLTFTESTGVHRIVCPTTLNVTYEPGGIVADPGNAIGTISGAALSGCTGGSAVFVAATVTQRIGAFLGTFPAPISGMRTTLDGLAFKLTITIFGIRNDCTYATGITWLQPWSGGVSPYTRSTSGSITGANLVRTAGGSLCPATASVAGTLTFIPQTVTI